MKAKEKLPAKTPTKTERITLLKKLLKKHSRWAVLEGPADSGQNLIKTMQVALTAKKLKSKVVPFNVNSNKTILFY